MAVRKDNTAEVLLMDDVIKAQMATVEHLKTIRLPNAKNLEEVVNLLESIDRAEEHLARLWTEHNGRVDREIQAEIDEADKQGEFNE